ncbi:hypothetical protein [Pararhodospirillum oryzae]|nr:hypothetical protein [Pararhodospirillum oryzae]
MRGPKAGAPGGAAVLLAGLGLMAAGCGPAGPFVDYEQPRETPVIRTLGSPERAAVCFRGDAKAQAAELQALADAHCARQDLKARFTDIRTYQCSVLHPHVAYYTCVPEAEAAEAAGPGSDKITAPGPVIVPPATRSTTLGVTGSGASPQAAGAWNADPFSSLPSW